MSQAHRSSRQSRSAQQARTTSQSTSTTDPADALVAQQRLGNQHVQDMLQARGELGGGVLDAFEGAFEGGGLGELPFRAELEALFGTSLGDVEAAVDPTAASSMGAAAATDGERVLFASANPTFEDVAHEVAHVMQHRGGGGSATAAVDSGGGMAEAGADRAVEQALSGERVNVQGSPDALIHRRPGNEREEDEEEQPSRQQPGGNGVTINGPVYGDVNTGNTTTNDCCPQGRDCDTDTRRRPRRRRRRRREEPRQRQDQRRYKSLYRLISVARCD